MSSHRLGSIPALPRQAVGLGEMVAVPTTFVTFETFETLSALSARARATF